MATWPIRPMPTPHPHRSRHICGASPQKSLPLPPQILPRKRGSRTSRKPHLLSHRTKKGPMPKHQPLYIISLFLAETGNFTPFSAKNNSLLLLIMSSDILAVRVVLMDGCGTQDTSQHKFRNILLQCTRLVLYAYHSQNLLSRSRRLIAEL